MKVITKATDNELNYKTNKSETSLSSWIEQKISVVHQYSEKIVWGKRVKSDRIRIQILFRKWQTRESEVGDFLSNFLEQRVNQIDDRDSATKYRTRDFTFRVRPTGAWKRQRSESVGIVPSESLCTQELTKATNGWINGHS